MHEIIVSEMQMDVCGKIVITTKSASEEGRNVKRGTVRIDSPPLNYY
ncbi:MAG: hypothetical protein FWC52_03910 [Candidatus Methanoplasma sp.]|nr:hypothetical protein [Candidatus Methanoplasma sp.]